MSHRQKRLYQPSLSSYLTLHHSLSTTHSSSSCSSPSTSPPLDHQISAPNYPVLSPSLPNTIQSSLLSVGMRVRKAIPEGYKTLNPIDKDMDKENIYTPSKPRWVQATKEDGLGGAKKELAPYCAILDVGGLRPQSSSNATAQESARISRGGVDDIIFQDEDFGPEGGELGDPNGIGIAESACISARRDRNRLNRKRGLELENETEPDAISGQAIPGQRILRPIAQPKSRKMKPVWEFATIKEVDEEMMDFKPEEEQGNDFEEADFLRPMDYI